MTKVIDREGMVEQVKGSQLLRIICIAVLAGLLLVPVGMIDGVITERQQRRVGALQEVTAIWGDRQKIIGPFLVVPYLRETTEENDEGARKIRTEIDYAEFLPEALAIKGRLQNETRYRGIYKIPVYAADLDVSGTFVRPNFSELGIADAKVLWERAYLSLGVSDARAITSQVVLDWNGVRLPFVPGAGEFGGKGAGIHVPMAGRLSGKSFQFRSRLTVNGSDELFFAPFGKETVVEIASNWGSPGFQGNWLPVERRISDQGFRAKWRIPYLGRNYPQQWKSEAGFDETVLPSCFGLKFVPQLDQYAMAKRSTKYGVLFIVLTFITLWLFEITAKVRIHPIQYLLVGAGLALFFLLEISISEHIGFALAYSCATMMVTSLVYFYSRFILGGSRRSAVLAAVVLMLYGYLYVLLMNQDYALLIGSICLFLVLATIMFITRKIDWYSFQRQVPAPATGTLPDQVESCGDRHLL